MRKKKRVSLTWSVVTTVAVVTAMVVAAQQLLNERVLQQQFARERAARLTQLENFLEKMYYQWGQKVEQIAGVLAASPQLQSATESENRHLLDALVEDVGTVLQFDAGVEMIAIFGSANQSLLEWGGKVSDNAELHEKLDLVQRSTRPASLNVCMASECLHLVILPIPARDTKRKGVLIVGFTMLDLLFSFEQVVNAEVRLLPSKSIPAGMALAARGEFEQMEFLYPTAFPMPPDYNIAVVFDTRENAEAISAFQQRSLTISILGLAVLLCSILITLWNPLKRLRRTAAALPNMAQGDLETMQAKLGSQRRLFRDEVDELAENAINTSRQIEQYRKDLREQIRFQGELIQALPLPVYFTDARGAYLGVNKAWETFFGVAESAIYGKTVRALFSHSDQAADFHQQKDHELLRQPGTQVYETETITAHGRRYLTVYTKATYTNDDGSVVGSIGTIIDLTERKRAEREARQALVEKVTAEEASKAKSAFLANVSHELRTPLNSVIVLSDALKNAEDKSKCQQFSEVINTSAKHLLDLIDQIIDISQIELGKFVLSKRGFSIAHLLESVKEIAVPQAKAKGLDLTAAMAQGLPAYVEGDELRLRQILLNLVSNAIKFTMEGGVALSLSGRMANDDADCFMFRFDISDTGAGFSAADQQRIFEKFERVKGTSAPGSGLGLAIVKELVELMGGRLGVVSAQGKGSTFWFEVPFAIATADETPPEQVVRRNGKAWRVLVAEDSRVNQYVFRELVTSAGFDAVIVSDGEEAVDALLSKPFDIAIVDLQMPLLGGLDVIRLIRDNNVYIPAIIVTADATTTTRRECENVADRVLTKPVVPEDLIGSIHELCERYWQTGPVAP